MNLSQFLSIQPWLLPVTEDTYQHLLSSSHQFYTILCDSFCRILYQDQYCEISITSPAQSPPLALPPPPSPLRQSIHHQPNTESKSHLVREGKQFDIPIELLIAISPSPTASSRHSSNHSPSLFLKINHELYLTNHTAIQELTFPKQQPSPAADQLYLLLKWPTCTFYLYILPDQSSLSSQQGSQYSAPIIYEKLSSAVISMNRILKCSLASYEKLKQQLQETFQRNNSIKLHQFQEKNHHPHPRESLSSSSVECSSTTVGGDVVSSSPSEITESTSLLNSLESLLKHSSHLFALDCIQSSLHHWMDTTTISRHLLQPILPSPLYHELLLSSHFPPNSLPQNSSSQASHPKKRSLPASPMTPSQTFQSSLNSPLSKRPKVRPIDRNGLPSVCLLNLPKDITISDSITVDSAHPYLESCLHSLSSSLLSIEESESLERILYETLDSMEAKILSSYSNYFALSRATPSPSPGEPKPINNIPKFSEELEKIFAMPYRTLIEDITTLRLLPRNDRRPLHPHPSQSTSAVAEYSRKKSTVSS